VGAHSSMVEHVAHNDAVVGSTPAEPKKDFHLHKKDFHLHKKDFHLHKKDFHLHNVGKKV
jgi:hypothetical protein